MNLFIIGCEYSGTTTLTCAISDWAEATLGVSKFGFHDHWKAPHLGHPKTIGADSEEKMKYLHNLVDEWRNGNGDDPTRTGFDTEEQELYMALSPVQREAFQRYHIAYHIGEDFYSTRHHNITGMHVDEAVYAGLYYGYGGEGEYADRKAMAPNIEETMLKKAPNTVLILIKADPEIIRKRMRENPHQNGLVQDKDVEFVLQRFQEEYDRSSIKNRFEIDTSSATVKESLAVFVENIDDFLTAEDRNDILVHRAKQNGEWI